MLDVREIAGYTDYFLLCSGGSDRQVSAIAEHMEETLKKEHGITPIGTEGVREGRWALIDYGDIVVHIFLSDVLEFYNFDRLWGAAQEAPLPEE
ncbi:MAG: ribosome silencing factor [Syntrophorhabdaceae bacterium]|nr:ribosome silencing factor [Syntrophorhabdaceae bacterium]